MLVQAKNQIEAAGETQQVKEYGRFLLGIKNQLESRRKKLIEKLGGEVVQLSFIIELSFLNGRDKFKEYNVKSLITYDSEN